MALRNERQHFAPGIHDLHRMLGRSAAEVTAEGAAVMLSDGRRMVDFGSYAVTLLGHRPPDVVAAVQASLDRMPTSTRLLVNPTTASFAAALATAVGRGGLDRVVLGLNGSDVVEATCKLAIVAAAHPEPRLLAVEGAFHGKTLGALALTWDPQRRAGLEPLLRHVTFVPPEADAVAAALEERPAAALFFEPIQGEGGGKALPPEVLTRWCRDAHDAGAFVIADEIQVGLRRCGPMSVSAELGLDVDAVLFGKPLGGGVLPLSAALCNDSLYRPLREDPFFHTATFAGHPATCAAGIAALTWLTSDAAAADVARVERALATGLQMVARLQPELIDDAWVFGAFGVLRFHSQDLAHTFLLEAARLGVLLAPCLTAPDTLRVLVPLVTDDEILAEAIDILSRAATDTAKRVGLVPVTS